MSDVLIRSARSGREVSLRGVLRSLRAAGLTPHPWGEAQDDDVLELIAPTGRTSRMAADPSAAFGGAGRSRWLGVDRAKFPSSDDPDTGERFGFLWQVLADVADTGAGWFREAENNNLLWTHLFPESEIPRPTEIASALAEDHFRVLSTLGLVILCCMGRGVRFLPMLFAAGGGEGVNSPGHADSDPVHDRRTDTWGDATYGELRAGSPVHQPEVIVPTASGWDPFYYSPHLLGYSSTEIGANQAAFQRYGLNVYFDSGLDDQPVGGADAARTAEYMLRVAARKSLALLAFGNGLGQFLAGWDAVLQSSGLDLLDYLPYLEFGQELDAVWANSAGMVSDTPTEDSPRFEASSREYARLHLCLACGVLSAWPRARFKASELACWAQVDVATLRPRWMGLALTTSLSEEIMALQLACDVLDGSDVEGFSELEQLQPLFQQVSNWISAASASDVDLPALARTGLSSQLVHSVGMHYFRWWDYDRDPPANYRDPTTDDVITRASAAALGSAYAGEYQNELDFWNRTFEPFRLHLLDPLRELGVRWSLGNLGFPSQQAAYDITPLLSLDATPEYRAGYHVRMTLFALGCGASQVMAYSHLNNMDAATNTSAPAAEFAYMGIRFDDPEGRPFTAAESARPRSVWYAVQRLCWLLSSATGFTIVHSADGLVVIRINGSGFQEPGRPARRYRYAFVCWLDKKAQASWAVIQLKVSAPGAFARVPLVPRDPVLAGPPDPDSGYATALGSIDWGDADPADHARFGHADQALIEWGNDLNITLLRTLPSSHERGTGAERSGPSLPNPDDLGNVGIVAWLTDDPSFTFIGSETG